MSQFAEKSSEFAKKVSQFLILLSEFGKKVSQFSSEVSELCKKMNSGGNEVEGGTSEVPPPVIASVSEAISKSNAQSNQSPKTELG